MPKIEVEIKSLIGNNANALQLVERMRSTDASFRSIGAHVQRNHYFVGSDLRGLRNRLAAHLAPERDAQLHSLIERVKDFSVRTRWADGRVLLVVKATVDATSSSNGTAREEFESEVPMTLDALDQLVIAAGFSYQAKWSRERQEYLFEGLNVAVDKNAGYGYLVEFESVIEDASEVESTKKHIRDIMTSLDVEELDQDRLARMFAYYNLHWRDYYGTDKTFTIE